MNVKIFLLAVFCSILLLGQTNTLIGARQYRFGPKLRRKVLIALGLALLVGTYSIVDLPQAKEPEQNLEPVAENQEEIEQIVSKPWAKTGEPSV